MTWLARMWRWIALVPGRRTLVQLQDGTLWRGHVRAVGLTWVELSYTRETQGGWTLTAPWTSFAWRPRGAAVRGRGDEGLTWCRGWTGIAADALRAAVALRD